MVARIPLLLPLCFSCLLEFHCPLCFPCPQLLPINSKNDEKDFPRLRDKSKVPKWFREKPDGENSTAKMFITLKSRRRRRYFPLACIHLLFCWTTSTIINSRRLHSSLTFQPSQHHQIRTTTTMQTPVLPHATTVDTTTTQTLSQPRAATEIMPDLYPKPPSCSRSIP